MSEKVKMTIECLGQMCGNCPELDIEINRLELTDGVTSCYINKLRCSHLSKCESIYLLMKKDWEENNVTRLEHRP